MLVADHANNASSAVLGAQKTLAVTMEDDASFFMMMSSNLYSNQLLAALREPLCNAWDAMIEAGTTDQSIIVDLNMTTGDISIKDAGLGIPKDKIAEIYGTYGKSTKRNDSKTTGTMSLDSILYSAFSK